MATWAKAELSWPPTWATAPMTRARHRPRGSLRRAWQACRSGPGLRAGWQCAPTPGTSPARWPASRTRRASASRSAPSGSRRCGGCCADRRGRLARRDRHGRRPGRHHRVLPGLDGRREHGAAGPPGPAGPGPSRTRGPGGAAPLHPDQRALPLPSWPARRSPTRSSSRPTWTCPARTRRLRIALVPAPRRGRTCRDSKLGAALPAPSFRIPPGQPGCGCGGGGAAEAASAAGRLAAPARCPHRRRGHQCAGHGVRGGKAMIATLRWRLIRRPWRADPPRPPPDLAAPARPRPLPEVLARLRDLPAPT